MIYPILLVISDFVALLSAFTLAYIIRVQVDSSPLVVEIPALSFIKVFMLLIPIWILVNAFLGLYTKPVYEKRLTELAHILIGSFIGMLVVIGFDFIRDETIFPARLVAVYAFIGSFILLALYRNILWLVKVFAFRFGFGVRGVMIIGNTEATRTLASSLDDTISSGYKIQAIVGNSTIVPKGFKGKHYSYLKDALADVHKLSLNTIIQTEMYNDGLKNRQVFEVVRNNHLQYKFIPAQADFYTGSNTVEILQGFPVISVHQTPLVGWGRVVKRLLDFFAATMGLILLSPFMLIIAIVIKVNDPKGKVFYKQVRVTRFNTKFYIYKFRTMGYKYSTGPGAPYKTNEAAFKAMGREDVLDEYEKFHKVKDDPRITGVGRFLRKTSLDELPQLWNVVKGELSVVGPRAMTDKEARQYRKYSGGDVVLSVKGGITGLWQVSGRSELTMDERVQLELYYVQNWSLWLDFKIVIKTFAVVLKGSGSA